MFIIHVQCIVNPDQIDAFKATTIDNAQNTLREPGALRFDVIQEQDDPTRFMLVEIYRTQDDHARHKQTPHYEKWAAAAPDMLAEPRTRIFYNNICPNDQDWK